MITAARPIVGVVADVRVLDGQPFHMAQDKYLRALWAASGVLPVILPSFGGDLDLQDVIADLDGILLTGAISNVEPWRYGDTAGPGCEPFDPERDATSLPFVDAALSSALPLFAICRGFQELNVALGGSLEQRVHELPDHLDHRARYGVSLEEQYAPVHEIWITSGGLLSALNPGIQTTLVNSLHWQGIKTLAPRLSVEATAPDGIIEAVRVTDAANFAFGVQWHPEWDVMASPFSVSIFRAFGDAARARHAARVANAR